MEITHFSHRHPLALSDGMNNEVICSGCRQPISGGPVYSCESCKYFIHKSCSELPQQLDDHPFHPLHRRLTIGRQPHRLEKFDCGACRVLCSGFVFCCPECDFKLDVVCASLRPSTSEENQEQQIELFSHQHPLIPVTCYEYEFKIKCFSCNKPINGLIYVCFGCQFFIHKSCAELLQQIRHHIPEVHAGYKNYCTTCEMFPPSSGLIYGCGRCGFRLDIIWPWLKVTINEERQEQLIEHVSHKHPLTSIPYFEDIYNIACSVCSLAVTKIDGSVYVCFICKYLIHNSCAEFTSRAIQHHHPFHPLHDLTLAPGLIHFDSSDGWPPLFHECSACGEKCYEGFVLHCSSCNFAIHVICAMLLPTIGNEQFERQIQHPSHGSHPLIPFDGNTREMICPGCEGILGGSGYVCPQCLFFLCQSCTELPEEYKHPFHQHPLTFLPTTTPHGNGNGSICLACRGAHSDLCNACGKKHSSFVYHCAECQFHMGLKCASLPTVKYERHEHPLAVVKPNMSFKCRRCNFPCRRSFLRCVLCDLNLHLKCIPTLPHTVKVKTHRHWLTLIDPLPVDDYYKYYCNACEKERNPKHSFYSCAQCEFVADIKCGISNEVISPGEESLVVQQLLNAGFDVFQHCFSDEETDKDPRKDATGGKEGEEADHEIDSGGSSKQDHKIDSVDSPKRGHENDSADFSEGGDENDSVGSSEPEEMIEALTKQLKELVQKKERRREAKRRRARASSEV